MRRIKSKPFWKIAEKKREPYWKLIEDATGEQECFYGLKINGIKGMDEITWVAGVKLNSDFKIGEIGMWYQSENNGIG